MAKQTEDREDLLRDGTAMPVRGRLIINGNEVVVGFRPQGQLSLYWDQDPVFQFDEAMQLRRVFVDSSRFKADDGRLVRLIKKEVHDNLAVGRLRLSKEPLSKAEQQGILQTLSECLQQIDHALALSTASPNAHLLETVGTTNVEFADRVRKWIADHGREARIAKSPSA